MTTRITENNITAGSITANSFAAGISLGGDDSVTIDQIIITDSGFSNTSDTEIPTTGGYLKLYGNNYTANSNVYYSTSFALTSQATANVISNNEIQVTIGATTADIYNLFVFNNAGVFAFKENAVTTITLGFGWFAGGQPSGASLIDRINFSSDTDTASVRGTLTVSRSKMAATSTDDYGWFGGGYSTTPGPWGPAGPKSTVERVTFLTDTAAASARGPLNVARNVLAAEGNNNYGWFGGGNPNSVTSVERITYSADTATATLRGNFSVGRSFFAATANDDYGWFGGGNPGSLSTVDRINFGADTGTASVRGPLSLGRAYLAATGNDNFGWFGGGGIITSIVDRINYAADTATASVRGPLSLTNYIHAAVSNQNYAWFGGGYTSGAASSIVDRIDFAADTATASLRGPLSAARTYLAATSGIA